ncbi:MAG: hypothetical protein NXH75_00080 [Halobacteriovoraceae bacterium]|nr:hypothetical protein [Halobacteriovoraceae bacterium]
MKIKLAEIHQAFKKIDQEKKLDLFRLGFSLFLLFFSYPLLRSTTTSLLITHHGAKASPYAWIYSVMALSIVVTLINSLQNKLKSQHLYLILSGGTTILFLIFYFLLIKLGNIWAYPLYVLKEVYIVLLVHSVLGHLNASVDEGMAKLVYGPLGALGSMGGIIGAFLTSGLVKSVGESVLLLSGIAIVLMTNLFFWFTSEVPIKRNPKGQQEKKPSPIASTKGARVFIFLVAMLVLLSQFIINIGNYQFNIQLGDLFATSVSKTEYLGKVYGTINIVSLLIQITILPILFRYVKPIYTHLSIPLVYGAAFLFSLMMEGSLIPLTITFVVFKGVDYSLFGAAKELLYFALSDLQKYGAKYGADMITYRLAKGLISLILIKIPTSLTNPLLGVCLGGWIVCLIPLFKQYKTLHKLQESPNESNVV